MNPQTVGEKHYRVYLQTQSLMKEAVNLERIASLIGESELSAQNQIIYRRAKLIRNYMTQRFATVSDKPNETNAYVPREQTIDDVKQILEGKCDERAPETLMYILTLADLK
jgi:F-type H+-transporting ATPase subunit beta